MKFLRLFLITAILALGVYWVSAQQSENSTTEPNWCYEGQAWGDGRCNHSDPDIQAYNWKIGWLLAQCESGNLPREDCYAPIVTSDFVAVGANTSPLFGWPEGTAVIDLYGDIYINCSGSGVIRVTGSSSIEIIGGGVYITGGDCGLIGG